MKLLRLISNTESQADFNVLFQEAITLKPNSTIGLQNFSLFFDDEMIEVNDENNSFTMEFSDTENQDKIFGKFTLTNGTYNATQFVDELNFQMNKGLANLLSAYGGEISNSENFMEISCVLDKTTNNLSITYATQTSDTMPSYLALEFLVSNGDNEYSKNAVSNFDWAFGFTSKTTCEGQSNMFMSVSNVAGTISGVAIGYMSLQSLPLTIIEDEGLKPELYRFCVFNDDGTVWKIKYPDGTVQATLTACANNDKISITKGAYSSNVLDPLAFDTFGYKISVQKGMVSLTLAQIPYDYGEQLHGAISIRDELSTIVDYTFTPSPSNVSDKYGSGIHIVKDFRLLEKNNYYSNNVGGDPEPPYNKLFLNLGENVAKLLGFSDPVTSPVTGATGSWTANISIYATIIPSSIIIELPNTHFHSYDGDSSYKRRRNILSIIPAVNLEQENTKISYEPAFPVMLDMLNKNEELLTNVRVRVLDLDNVPLRINTNKGVSIALLLN